MKIKGDYLYLLAFDNSSFFKIGISSKNFNRVCTHNKNYKINYYNSYIVTSTKRIVKSLESELLTIYPSIKDIEYKNIDGYTEIRDIKYLRECIDYIRSKHINLDINIYNSMDLIKNKIINISFINKGVDFEFELNLIRDLFNEWGLIEMHEYIKQGNFNYNTIKNRIKSGKIPTLTLGKTEFIIKKLL